MTQATEHQEADERNCEAMGDCEDSRIQRIYEYLDGALSHDDIVEVRNHLESCHDCNREHDLECIIRSVVKRSCCEKAPENLKSSILTKIDALRRDGGH